MANLVHDDAIYWPNGEGYTECTREYAAAVERNKVDPDDCEFATLQEQGHIGERVRFAAADPLMAMLGGSTVRPVGDGTWEVTNVPGSRITIADPDAILTFAKSAARAA